MSHLSLSLPLVKLPIKFVKLQLSAKLKKKKKLQIAEAYEAFFPDISFLVPLVFHFIS